MSFYKKPKIPYEIKNAREWDPRKIVQDGLSSEGEDDHDFENGYRDGTSPSSHERQAKALTSMTALEDDNDGFKPVIRRFTKTHKKKENAPKSAESRRRTVRENKNAPMNGSTPSDPNQKPQSEYENWAVATRTSNTPSEILLDQHGQRVDPVVQCDPHEVNRIQKLNLCRRYFLNNDCSLEETCSYNHQYKPTKDDLQTLEFISSTLECRLGTKCKDARCMYGHRAANNSIIQDGGSSRAVWKAPLVSLQPTTNHQFPINDRVSERNQTSPQRSQTIFRYQRDNLARAAFRRRETFNGKFLLHKKIIEIEPDPNCLEVFLVELGIRIGSFIRPPQTAQDRELMIWGNPKQVSQTQEELKDWIRRSEGPKTRKAPSKENFAHEYSPINVKYQDIQREILKKAQIHRYQQIPDPHQLFEYQGAYLWPIEDVVPQDIFGPNLEAFDQMRVALKSHIVFDDKLQSFRVYTDDDESIAKALKLIEGTLKEFHARNACSGRPSSVLIIDPPMRKNNGKGVRIQTWSSSTESTEHHVPVLTSDKLDPKAKMEWEAQRRVIITSNAIKIQEALELVLPGVRFHRGQISMKIFFGTFALTQFKWPKEKPASIPFEDFLRNMTEKGTKSQIIRDLRLDRDPSDMLAEIYSLNNALKTLDSTTESLDEVARTYGARFEIIRFERPAMQLEVEMQNSVSEKGLFEKTHSVWTRLDRKDSNVPVEISMLRLGGGASWKLQISTENQLDKWRMDQQMVEFADSVKLKGSKTGAELDGRRLFEWGTASPGILKPSVFEQKIALRYRLAYDQAFVFEIARYDSYDLSTNAQTPSTTHWGASMWNSDWDLILSENAGLGLGECAYWDPRLRAFFPNPEPSSTNSRNHEVDPGLEAFLHHVHMTSENLDRIKGVPLLHY